VTRAKVRRWTRLAHPCPWEYRVPVAGGMVRGHTTTWQHAMDRTWQIIADQT
jgi:hypothetical protein